MTFKAGRRTNPRKNGIDDRDDLRTHDIRGAQHPAVTAPERYTTEYKTFIESNNGQITFTGGRHCVLSVLSLGRQKFPFLVQTQNVSTSLLVANLKMRTVDMYRE